MAGLLFIQPSVHGQTTTLEATFTQQAGCTLGTPTLGTMTLSQDFKTMGTETPGGQRPSIMVTNIGNAVFTVDTWHMWGRYMSTNGSVVMFTPASTLIEIRDTSTGGTKVGTGKQVSLTGNGSRVYHFINAGTDSFAFYTAATYKLTAGVTCI